VLCEVGVTEEAADSRADTVRMLRPLLACLVGAAAFDGPALQQRLDDISRATASKYDCQISIAMHTAKRALTAASDGDAGKPFVWGSVTKLLTGTAILRAVERGQLALDQPVAPLVDPLLATWGLRGLGALFGKAAEAITIEQLGRMRSGVPDFDTAKPYPRPPTDAFRAAVYATPTREYHPADLLNLSWVANGSLDFAPGSKMRYSSTNFVLLGLALAAVHKAAAWDDYDQAEPLDALPPAARAAYAAVRFGVHGAPAALTPVRGFDRTDYNGHNASARPGTEVSRVAGVYAGWTASDLTAPVADTARLAYQIFGAAGPRLLSPPSVATMIPRGESMYGFATFNLSWGWGPSAGSPYYEAYGHLGATYGYQSIVAYFPGADVAVSAASNIEVDSQAQPSEALCLAYNAILAALTNTTEPACTFTAGSYYGGLCDCGNTYYCHPWLKICTRSPEKGSFSKEDCEKAC
jgi:CubicO group peptidase (beta-lactamase class C family)